MKLNQKQAQCISRKVFQTCATTLNEKINKRFEEINSQPAEKLTDEEAASLAEAEAINDGTTVELESIKASDRKGLLAWFGRGSR